MAKSIKLKNDIYWDDRGIVHDGVRKTFGLVHQEGHTHLDVGLALVNGNGLFAAGIVAAGAAVQLVLGSGFAHLFKYFRDLSLGGNSVSEFDRLEDLSYLFTVRLGNIEVLFAGVVGDRRIIGYR